MKINKRVLVEELVTPPIEIGFPREQYWKVKYEGEVLGETENRYKVRRKWRGFYLSEWTPKNSKNIKCVDIK